MSNEKHYPLHPNATHPQVMTCEIPLEEYESLKRENAQLKGEIKRLENVRKVHIEGIESMSEGLKLDAKQICRLKRALWLARAERAEARKNYWYVRSIHEGDKDLLSIDGSDVKYIGCIKRSNFDWLKIWSEVESKCRAKAEGLV